jgi:hypothetical protein
VLTSLVLVFISWYQRLARVALPGMGGFADAMLRMLAVASPGQNPRVCNWWGISHGVWAELQIRCSVLSLDYDNLR